MKGKGKKQSWNSDLVLMDQQPCPCPILSLRPKWTISMQISKNFPQKTQILSKPTLKKILLEKPWDEKDNEKSEADVLAFVILLHIGSN